MENSSQYIIADAVLTERGFAADRAVYVKNGIIVGSIQRDRILHDIPVLDFSGYRIAPCFCDHHLHFFRGNAEKMQEIADDLISWGITKAVDGGDPHCFGMEMKKAEQGRIEILTSGHALYKAGSYGRYIGREVRTLQEAEERIRSLAHDGADYIKIVDSGVFDPDGGVISSGGFTSTELKHIVAFAEASGLRVSCHANGDTSTREAVEAGVSTIIHGLGVSSETLVTMAEKGTAFVPTVNAFASLASKELTSQAHENIRQAVQRHLAAVKKASDLGVTVLPGSDAGPAFIPYGASFFRELALFEQAGISVEKILLSAAAFGLERGSSADFLVLDGLAVRHVLKKGVITK